VIACTQDETGGMTGGTVSSFNFEGICSSEKKDLARESPCGAGSSLVFLFCIHAEYSALDG
jgi:hypothetical protein